MGSECEIPSPNLQTPSQGPTQHGGGTALTAIGSALPPGMATLMSDPEQLATLQNLGVGVRQCFFQSHFSVENTCTPLTFGPKYGKQLKFLRRKVALDEALVSGKVPSRDQPS